MIYKASVDEQIKYLKEKPLDEVVEAYLPLVEAVVSRYPDLDSATAIDRGVTGLEEAVRGYQERIKKGKTNYKFSAYATYFINEVIESLEV